LYVIVQPELGSKVRLKFYVQQGRVDRAYQRLFQRLGDRGDIPGFRKGKVPVWRIRREYGDEAVDGAIFGELMEEAFRSLLVYGDVQAVEIADFGDDDKRQAKAGQPLETEAVMRVRPDTRIPDLSGVEIKVPDTEPTEEQIEERIRDLRDAAAEINQVEDREAREGDLVEVTLKTKVEGEDEEEERDEAMIVGENRYDPPIDTDLLGRRAGETVEFTVEYPDKLTMGDLAGKTVQMAATINVISERHLPEIDDKFAAEAAEAASVDELREKVAEEVRRANEELADRVLRNRVARWLADAVRVDLPETIRQAAATAGAEDELGEEMEGINTEEIVKLSLACDAVLTDRNVAVDDADIMQEYVQAGEEHGLDPDKLMSDDMVPEVQSIFRERVIRRKAIDIVAQAVTRKPIPLSQFLEDADTTEAGQEEEQEPQDVSQEGTEQAGAETKEQENE
jgi:trigger factor